MEIINLDTWDRVEHFNFFKNADYPQYNICMNLDITNFRRKVKEKKLSFYYAMIYAAMQAANEIPELKYRFHGDQVVLHNKIHPSFTDLAPGSDLFKLVTVDLEDTMEEFVAAAKDKSEHQTEYFALADLAGRDDLAYITCIPWISFTHLSHTINLRKDDAVPRISWGKYFEEGDKTLLPFSVQVHHAFADGIHVGRYVEKLQNYLDD
jgi:chloramphenicol O-acetyltransferase type A